MPCTVRAGKRAVSHAINILTVRLFKEQDKYYVLSHHKFSGLYTL